MSGLLDPPTEVHVVSGFVIFDIEVATRDTLRLTSQSLTFHRIGSMFCLFFTGGPVNDLASAKQSDRAAFARFFRYCLDHGIYFAPSQFETGFLSTAHTASDLTRTGEVVAAAIAGACAA